LAARYLREEVEAMSEASMVPAAGEYHLAGLNLSAQSTSFSAESSITAIQSTGGSGSARDNLLNLINGLPAGQSDEDLLRALILLLVLEMLRGGSDRGQTRAADGGQFSFLHVEQSVQFHSEQVSLQMASESYAGNQVGAIASDAGNAQSAGALDVTA
jgi:hypothetical protein